MLDLESQKQKLLNFVVSETGINDEKILDTFLKVPREDFVLEEYIDRAYSNVALPLEEGQTISQPSLVIIMTAVLKVKSNHKVLEIGTGSGYQTALLSFLAKQIYTVERIPELSEKAAKTIEKLGLKNINFFVGDGSKGLADYAPYERIIVTAGAKKISEELIEQLSVGGRMVIPVGAGRYQTLKVIDKVRTGLIETNIEQVSFVPLISDG